ncbi:hypothetical protein [uncultured Parabacteroides sp.]|uniref:hypothetical protein n=1 Tax=uncultured Parabacteroides sp. TaxID=512312 RepID=UPI0026300E76|nr:hypothetical protein [uncultured Parabacteroides sp.]
MSFAGHVSDMIRRSKESRNTLDRLRERTREARKRYIGTGEPKEPEITLEELLRIERLLKEREAQEQRYRIRVTILIISVSVIIILLSIEILKTYLFHTTVCAG